MDDLKEQAITRALAFKKYVNHEIKVFYIPYFKTTIYDLLVKWASDKVQDDKNKVIKHINDFLEKEGVLVLGADANSYSADPNYLNRKDEDKLFWPIQDMLKKYLERWNYSFDKWYEEIVHYDTIYSNTMVDNLNLAIADSRYANDDYGNLSPFGPWLVETGELTGHDSVGVLDALKGMLPEKGETTFDNEAKLILKAQIMLILMYREFKRFCKALSPTDRAIYLKKDWKNPPLIQFSDGFTGAWAADREVPTIIHVHGPKTAVRRGGDIGSQKEALENRKQKFENILENIDLNKIDNAEAKKVCQVCVADLQNQIDHLTTPKDKQLPKLQREMEHLEELQGKKEPNKKEFYEQKIWEIQQSIDRVKNTDEVKYDRVLAFAAVPHEFGHDISDTFYDDALIQELIGEVHALNIPEEHKAIWGSWVHEIFADLVGVGILGLVSVDGLFSALRHIRAPRDIITGNADPYDRRQRPYDPHPNPVIRGYISLEAVRQLGKGKDDEFRLEILRENWDRYSFPVRDFVFKNELTGNTVHIGSDEIESVVDIVLHHTPRCFDKRIYDQDDPVSGRRSLKDLLDHLMQHESVRSITENFEHIID